MVGSCPALGAWDVATAPDLHWTDGDVWTQAVEVPAGAQIEYKVDKHYFWSTYLWGRLLLELTTCGQL